jgi:hypothetical protein
LNTKKDMAAGSELNKDMATSLSTLQATNSSSGKSIKGGGGGA